MKIKVLLILLFIISFQICHAQKGIEKLTAYKIDSLQHIHVDTILYYNSYCGECAISGKGHTCYLKSGYILDDNLVIYKQSGKFYILSFDCYNSNIKRQLDSCKSLPYFITIIPALNEKYKFFKYQQKKVLFAGPSIADGGFEYAEIIINKKKRYFSMSQAEKIRLRNTDKSHYWVNKEIKLLKLVAEDIAINKAD